jgi:protein SCO1
MVMWSVRVRLRIIGGLLLLLVPTVSCVRAAPSERQFELRGQILEVRSDTELLVKHDDIKGFMPAMTMPYKLRDAQVGRGRAAGDLIRATLVVTDTDAWITDIEKTGAAPLPETNTATSSGRDVPLLRPGDLAPDTPLTDEQGRAFSPMRWRGSAIAVTFIYTRCPLPQYCPALDRRFAAVQRLIQNDPSLNGRARLLSVSFDPDVDTPAALRAHAKKLNADPQVWRFATAPRDDVARFAAAFGINVIREQDKTITHNMRTALIDPNGRVLTIYDGTEWTADQIAADLGRALASK